MKLSQLPVGALVKDPNTKYNNDVIIWQVLEHGHSGDPLGSTTLQSRDILTLKCFDAMEPNNADSNRKASGNNRYKYSNILQWLNADKNNWYEAQHSADQEPSASYVWAYNGTAINPYSSEAGFLTNFSDQFKKALMTVSKTTVLATVDGDGSEVVSSKIFLPSVTEVGFSNEHSIAEGSIYSLYNKVSYRIKNLANDAAKGNYSEGTSPNSWWLRTPDYSTSYAVRRVLEDGSSSNNYTYVSCRGTSPALCISSNIEVSDTTDSDGVYTLKFAPQATKVYVGDSNGLAKQIWPETAKIYGAVWDGSALTSWTRTDDAADFSDPNPYYAGMSGTPSSPFDNIQPWAGMVRSTDANAGEVVAIPKFYYKMDYATGTTGLKIQICSKKLDGFKTSPAHMDRGDGKGERDVVYVGRYHCASDYKSKTSVTPKVNATRASFRSGIHGLGTNVWQWDYATCMSLRMLYLVEFADWNSQATIGAGCAPTGQTSAVRNMGYTDSMAYHTGTTETNIGVSYFGGTQYRNIEGIWDNCYDWIDGIYFSGSSVYSILNPANFSDSSNGTLVTTRATSSGYPSAFNISSVNNYDWFIYPSAVSGSNSTYVCDLCEYNSRGTVLRGGGAYDQNLARGLFYYEGWGGASSAYVNAGSRLMILP